MTVGMTCTCGDPLRLEDITGHLYAHGIQPPWEDAIDRDRRIAAGIIRHEEIVLCVVCQRQRPPKGQMFCEDCWQKARKRMKDEEDA